MIEATSLPAAHRLIRPNTLLSDLLLSVYATAGFFYVNIMAVMVDALITRRGFTAAQAGMVPAFNVYGAVGGSLLALYIAQRFPWRRSSVVMLLLLMVTDFSSARIGVPSWLIAVRFVHGLIAGCLVGTSYTVMSRTKSPDRAFGMLLFLQYGVAGLALAFVPELVRARGAQVVFWLLLAFSLLTLLILPLIPEHVRSPAPQAAADTGTRRSALLRVVGLTLAAIFLFQGSNMSLAAFLIPLGQHFGLPIDRISAALGVSSWVSMGGAAAVILITTRYGRLMPIALGYVGLLASGWAYHFSASLNVYFIASCISGASWAFTIPYLFGICAEQDASGRSTVLAGLFSKLGLASGPLVGGMMIELTRNNYGMLIDASVAVLALSAVPALLSAAASLDNLKRSAP